MLGGLGQFLAAMVFLATVWTIGRLVVSGVRHQLPLSWWHAPAKRDLASAIARGSFWGMAILALHFNLAPFFLGISPVSFYGGLLGAGLVVIAGALLPSRPTWSVTTCFGLAFALSILELLVAALQAYIFTMLSALYFGMANEEAH